MNITSYQQYLIENEKAAATIEKYMRDIGAFGKWLSGRALDKAAALEYKEYLTERYAPRSVNSVISSLNSYFEFIGRHDCKIKTIKIQRQIFLSKEKELTKSEYDRLLNAAQKQGDERLYYLMQTICATGIRVSELKHITVEALNARQAEIRCKGKLRIIMLPKDLCKMLKGYTKSRGIKNGSVFVTRNGKPLDRTNIWAAMKRLCKITGVAAGKVFPHNLRHLFARTFYAIKKDIVRLADILGHSSVDTTRIYTMESGDNHRRQLERLNLLRC